MTIPDFLRFKGTPILSIVNRFELHTVTGVLLLINFLVFLSLCFVSESLFNIDTRALVLFGAKESNLIAQGDYWRLVTSMFLHAGWIHLAFNNIALKAVGRYMESLLGPKLFLLFYLLSGIGSSLCSNFFQHALSVGASGAIFGLVGVGVVIENALVYQRRGQNPIRSIAQYFRVCPFSFLSAINIAIAVLFNFFVTTFDFHTYMDNAAHLGGLATGMLLTLIYLHSVRNPLFPRSGPRAVFFTLLLVAIESFFAQSLFLS